MVGSSILLWPYLWLLSPNASKTWLVIKEQFHSHAVSCTFQDTAFNVMMVGPTLGLPLAPLAEYSDQQS